MTKTNTARTHLVFNTLTKQKQSQPTSRTLADTMAAQLNDITKTSIFVVIPAGWEGVGLN